MTAIAPSTEDTGRGLARFFALVRWNLSRALIITRREILDTFRDWRIIMPTLTLTIIFPAIANWGASEMVDWFNQFGAELLAERLFPFTLLIVGFFPSSFSLIIALESFAGEKERRSLEPLLSSPMSDLQLYIGKTLSSTIPPVLASWLGMGVYLAGILIFSLWEPPPILILQIVLLTTAQSFVMVSGAVVVSSQSTSVRAANLLASFIIIPTAFLVQAESYIMLIGNYNALWWVLISLLTLNVILARMGVRVFNREELLGREIDELNLPATLADVFRRALARRPAGPRRSAWQWYREEVIGVIGDMRFALFIVFAAMFASYFIGARYANLFPIPPSLFDTQDWLPQFEAFLRQYGFYSVEGVLLVIWQNVRVLAVASALAVFSFGLIAVLLLMVPLALVGYLLPQMIAAGIDPLTSWMLVIPHSIFEIPAAIIAGAAAVRLGATVISPPPGKTLGEGWLIAF
ncbi:MAG: ABC transporter permease subunit, partial [Chloroflexi bacterium]|nr:ABC transporter permease subunit [Chloroflexota bacterium]